MNRKKILLLSLGISLVSALLIILLTTNKETIEAIREIRPEYILLAAGIRLLSFVISAKRTKYLCRALGYRIRTRYSLLNILTGVFLAALTPSSVGGEPVRILLLKRNASVPVGKGTAVVFMERFLDAAVIVGALLPSLFIISQYTSSKGASFPELEVLLLAAAFVLIVVIGLCIYTILNPEKGKRLAHGLIGVLKRCAGRRYRDKIEKAESTVDAEIDIFCTSFRIFTTTGKVSLAVGFLATVAEWTLYFMILWAILLGFNYEGSFASAVLLMFAVQIVLTVIMIIPATPGASGISELGAFALFSLFVPSPILGVVVITWRAVTYYVNLIAGLAAGMITIRLYGKSALEGRIDPNDNPTRISVHEDETDPETARAAAAVEEKEADAEPKNT